MNQNLEFDDKQWLPQLEKVLAEGVFFQLPPLRRPPQYGVLLWWPSDASTNDWIHPDDIEIVEQFVPGNRILLRTDLRDSEYSRFDYGDVSFRVRPTIWLEVTCEPYQIGDLVEVKSQMGQSHSIIARVTEVFWNQKKQIAQFQLSQAGVKIPRLYLAEEFQLVPKLGLHKDWRMTQLIEQSRIR